jgi:hypothetical protein
LRRSPLLRSESHKQRDDQHFRFHVFNFYWFSIQ